MQASQVLQFVLFSLATAFASVHGAAEPGAAAQLTHPRPGEGARALILSCPLPCRCLASSISFEIVRFRCTQEAWCTLGASCSCWARAALCLEALAMKAPLEGAAAAA